MNNSGMLTRFIELFVDIYNIFISPDYPLYDYFKSILVICIMIVAIVGALLFASITISAVIGLFRTK